MPAKSKAQQRYMAIAEHNPTALYGPKPNMTHQELHDFAATSTKHLPTHVKASKPMHPKMHQRAAMVKEAHHHLKASVPEYSQATGRQRMLMTQHHVNLRLGKVK